MNEQFTTNTFKVDYESYKDYDDIVIHKKSRNVFEAYSFGSRVQLVSVNKKMRMKYE